MHIGRQQRVVNSGRSAFLGQQVQKPAQPLYRAVWQDMRRGERRYPPLREC